MIFCQLMRWVSWSFCCVCLFFMCSLVSFADSGGYTVSGAWFDYASDSLCIDDPVELVFDTVAAGQLVELRHVGIQYVGANDEFIDWYVSVRGTGVSGNGWVGRAVMGESLDGWFEWSGSLVLGPGQYVVLVGWNTDMPAQVYSWASGVVYSDTVDVMGDLLSEVEVIDQGVYTGVLEWQRGIMLLAGLLVVGISLLVVVAFGLR